MNAYVAHMLNFKHVIRHTQCIIWNLWHLRNHIMLIKIEYFAHNAKCAIYTNNILYSCVNKATGDLWSSVKLLGAQSLRNQVELGKIDWPIDPMNSVFICLYLVVSSSVDELRDIWEWRQGTPELVQVDWPIGRVQPNWPSSYVLVRALAIKPWQQPRARHMIRFVGSFCRGHPAGISCIAGIAAERANIFQLNVRLNTRPLMLVGYLRAGRSIL